MDEIHFETTDCKGCKIQCTKEQWSEHIIIPPHEYMEYELEEVILTLESPDFNIRHIDTDFPNRRCYYRISETKDYYTKVIVEFTNRRCNGSGMVITAYMPDEIKTGEKPEFP